MTCWGIFLKALYTGAEAHMQLEGKPACTYLDDDGVAGGMVSQLITD
jgi:hypothetical protein